MRRCEVVDVYSALLLEQVERLVEYGYHHYNLLRVDENALRTAGQKLIDRVMRESDDQDSDGFPLLVVYGERKIVLENQFLNLLSDRHKNRFLASAPFNLLDIKEPTQAGSLTNLGVLTGVKLVTGPSPWLSAADAKRLAANQGRFIFGLTEGFALILHYRKWFNGGKINLPKIVNPRRWRIDELIFPNANYPGEKHPTVSVSENGSFRFGTCDRFKVQAGYGTLSFLNRFHETLLDED